MMYMRSSDLFLGLPFNIASTALLLMIIARITNMKAKEICINICDCHIYEEHIEQVKEQLILKDEIYKQPKLFITKSLDNIEELTDDEKIKWIEELTYEDFKLEDYKCHKSIKALMK